MLFPILNGLQTTTGGTSSSPPVISTARLAKTLFHFRQVRHRAFRMFGRLVGVTGLAVGNGFLQVLDTLIQMGILDARGLRVFQRFFRMLRHSIGMALLAVIDCALRMFNRFTHVFVVGLGYQR